MFWIASVILRSECRLPGCKTKEREKERDRARNRDLMCRSRWLQHTTLVNHRGLSVYHPWWMSLAPSAATIAKGATPPYTLLLLSVSPFFIWLIRIPHLKQKNHLYIAVLLSLFNMAEKKETHSTNTFETMKQAQRLVKEWENKRARWELYDIKDQIFSSSFIARLKVSRGDEI